MGTWRWWAGHRSFYGYPYFGYGGLGLDLGYGLGFGYGRYGYGGYYGAYPTYQTTIVTPPVYIERQDRKIRLKRTWCPTLPLSASGLPGQGLLPTYRYLCPLGYRAYEPGIKAQVVGMAINSSIRDTARVFKINKNTVISTLKKASAIVQVNPLYLTDAGKPREVRLELACEAAEWDEQWSFVGNKSNQRWLWYTRRAQALLTTPFIT